MAVKQASFFAPDLTVIGTVHSPGTLEIEGAVKGDVAVADLVVGAQGRLNARVGAGRLASAGTVAGTIKARAVSFLNGCRFRGDVEYEALSIDPDCDVEARFHPVEKGSPRMAVLPQIPEETFRIGAGRHAAGALPARKAPRPARPATGAATAPGAGRRGRGWAVALGTVLIAGAAAAAVLADPVTRQNVEALLRRWMAPAAVAPQPMPAPVPEQAPPPVPAVEVPPLPQPPPATLRAPAAAPSPAAPPEPAAAKPEPAPAKPEPAEAKPAPAAAKPAPAAAPSVSTPVAEPPAQPVPEAIEPILPKVPPEPVAAPDVEPPPQQPVIQVAPVTAAPPLPEAPVVVAPQPPPPAPEAVAPQPAPEPPAAPAEVVEPVAPVPVEKPVEAAAPSVPVPLPKPVREEPAAAVPVQAPPVQAPPVTKPPASAPRSVTSTPDGDGCVWVVQCSDSGADAGKCVSTRQCTSN